MFETPYRCSTRRNKHDYRDRGILQREMFVFCWLTAKRRGGAIGVTWDANVKRGRHAYWYWTLKKTHRWPITKPMRKGSPASPNRGHWVTSKRDRWRQSFRVGEFVKTDGRCAIHWRQRTFRYQLFFRNLQANIEPRMDSACLRIVHRLKVLLIYDSSMEKETCVFIRDDRSFIWPLTSQTLFCGQEQLILTILDW